MVEKRKTEEITKKRNKTNKNPSILIQFLWEKTYNNSRAMAFSWNEVLRIHTNFIAQLCAKLISIAFTDKRVLFFSNTWYLPSFLAPSIWHTISFVTDWIVLISFFSWFMTLHVYEQVYELVWHEQIIKMKKKNSIEFRLKLYISSHIASHLIFNCIIFVCANAYIAKHSNKINVFDCFIHCLLLLLFAVNFVMCGSHLY